MARFTITVADADLENVTAARKAYNASRPPDAREIKTDGDYIRFVFGNAVTSWGRQHLQKFPKEILDAVKRG